MGSVRRAPRTGRWEARYRDPAGRQRTVTCDTKAEARAHLATVETDQRRGQWTDPRLARVTVADWAEEWRGTIVHLEPATIAWYDVMLRRHVLPAVGTYPVGSVDQAVVRRFVAELSRTVRPRTTKGAYQTLRNVLGVARGAGALRANPCEGVKLPRLEKRETLFLAPGQVAALADAIRPPYGVLVTFAAYTGLRAGELGALRVGRLDLLRGSVDVVEALKEVQGHLSFGPTKSHERRTVGVPRFLCEMLGQHIVGRSDPDALVFTAPNGGPLRHSAFRKRIFQPAVAAAGLPSMLRWHDLRHTAAALLIAQGAHPRAIMERLGHSSVEVSMDVYGHLFPSLDESLTDGLESTYRSAQTDGSWCTRGADVVRALPRREAAAL